MKGRCVPSVSVLTASSSRARNHSQAYLKSIKQPVGGKKGDLEERVNSVLGDAQVAAAVMAEA